MIGMRELLVILAVVVLTTGAVIGAVAITTGRLLPGAGRAKVLRPRVWGYGTLVAQAGMGVFLFLGPLRGSATYFPLSMAGMAAFFAGLYVQRLAQRPGRPGVPTA